MQLRIILLLILLLAVSVGVNVFLYSRIVSHQLDPFLNKKIQQIPETRQIVQKPVSSSTEEDNSGPENEKFMLALQLFNNHQFNEAMAQYEELQLINQTRAKKLKWLWLEQLKARLKSQQYKAIESFIMIYSQYYPYDISVLTMEAQLLAKQGNILEAIEVYYSLINSGVDIDAFDLESAGLNPEQQWLKQVHQLASNYLADLKQQLFWQQIIDFSETLLNYEPDYPPYRLSLAEALWRLKQPELAKDQLYALLEDQLYSHQAKTIFEQVNQAAVESASISLKPQGEHYLVSGQFNRHDTVELMIDTGASLSVLSQNKFDELSNWLAPVYIQHANINTAGGLVNAPIYQFEYFEINGHFVSKLNFVVMELNDMRNADGLLGMNYLKQFVFQIDQKNNLLFLSK